MPMCPSSPLMVLKQSVCYMQMCGVTSTILCRNRGNILSKVSKNCTKFKELSRNRNKYLCKIALSVFRPVLQICLSCVANNSARGLC